MDHHNFVNGILVQRNQIAHLRDLGECALALADAMERELSRCYDAVTTLRIKPDGNTVKCPNGMFVTIDVCTDCQYHAGWEKIPGISTGKGLILCRSKRDA